MISTAAFTALILDRTALWLGSGVIHLLARKLNATGRSQSSVASIDFT